MPYEEVEHPIPAPEAFLQTGDAAVQSQAALLLILGRQFRGDNQSLTARAAETGSEGFMEALPEEDIAEFPIPRIHPTGGRIAVRDIESRLAARYGRRLTMARIGGEEPEPLQESLSDLAEKLYQDPDPVVAAQLLEASLRHPDELTRVSAAASYFEISDQPRRLLRILSAGTRNADPLVRDVAATSLARVAPEHSRLRELMRSNPTPSDSPPSNTSLLVHGTFARGGAWWQPGGDFHSYLLAGVTPDLYSAPDRFEWSGGYSDAARALGAADLTNWVGSRGLDGLNLFTHSHGGSVAMLANQGGMRIGKLVLLSCPVHLHKYVPDFNRVGKVVSIRVRFDLVILADRGGQKFRHPNIEENVLPVWFNHSASHDPAIWEKHNVPSML